MTHSPSHRRRYAKDPDVLAAGEAAYNAAKAGWQNPDAGTPEEVAAARDASRLARIAAADEKLANE